MIRNEGIIQSGGTINAGAMATGTNPVASQSQSGEQGTAMQQVLLRMEELLQLLATQGHLLPNSDEVLHSAQTVKENCRKKNRAS